MYHSRSVAHVGLLRTVSLKGPRIGVADCRIAEAGNTDDLTTKVVTGVQTGVLSRHTNGVCGSEGMVVLLADVRVCSSDLEAASTEGSVVVVESSIETLSKR